jgi:hypothetical protein
MPKSVALTNGRSWNSQKAAEDHFRSIRDRHSLLTPIDNEQDHDDLMALLVRYDAAHDDDDCKIGCGVDHFEVRMNHGTGGATRGFWVVRIDGTDTDFSFIWAVRGIPKPEHQEFSDACRAAVVEDLQAAKRRFFAEYGDAEGKVACEITGSMVTIDDAHTDHAYPTFGALVVSFKAARSWHRAIPPGVLSRPQDNQTTTTFPDAEIEAAFRDFHHAAATLRVIAKGQNLRQAAGQRAPKIRRPLSLG